MLFLKYLWSETMFRLFIPAAIGSVIWLGFLLSWNLPLPWALVPIITMVAFAVIFFITLLICAAAYKIYEVTWRDGYVDWRRRQNQPPTRDQEELEKLKQVMDRYYIEVQIKRSNPAAKQIWEEYQCVLALSNGVKVAEDIELDGNRYKHCLKDYGNL